LKKLLDPKLWDEAAGIIEINDERINAKTTQAK